MNAPKLKTRAVISAYVGFAILAGSLAVACGDDADGDDPNVIPGAGGKASAGDTSDAGATEPGTGGTGGGSGGSGTGGGGGEPTETGGSGGAAGGNEPGSGGEAGGAENCDPQGEYDCYPCAPKTNEQYLNQCSDAECAPFDNAERIPGFDGTLPDL
jgi:hypothetical protein